MSNYILILVWIVILGIAAMFINVKRPEVVCGEKVERYYVVWAFLIFVPLIIWCGYRGNVGHPCISLVFMICQVILVE